MELSRRSFLRGTLSLTVLAATGLPVGAGIPTIHGNGVDDDTDGLQALFDGKPVHVEGETVVATDGYLSGGSFVVSRTLTLAGKRFQFGDISILSRVTSGPVFLLTGETFLYARSITIHGPVVPEII